MEEGNNSTIEKHESQVGKKLVKGATILAVAGILSKVLGAFFRIPLTNLIGAEGQAYYGAAYPVYSFFLVLSSAGIPVAIARMVAERATLKDHKNAHRVYVASLYLMITIGVISFVICFFGADYIAGLLKNPGAAIAIKALAPALLLAPLVSSYRGYFEGYQNMFPTGLSQVLEQFARVIVGLTLSFLLISKSLELAVGGATFGASAGLAVALVVLIIIFKKDRKKKGDLLEQSVKPVESKKSLLKELIEISIPITIGSTVMPLMMIIDNAVIMRRLQATGWTYIEAKKLYGLISGFTDPLISLPGVFIDAICISLMPAVTAAFTLKLKKELDKNVETGMKTMMIIAFPCAIGLIVLAKPILHLLYPARLDEADMAVLNLQISSLTILTLSFTRVLSGALQGIRKMVLPVINLFIGAVVKIIFTYTLVGIPSLNINGAAIGSVIAYLVSGILNFLAMKKYADLELNLTDVFVRPFVSAAIMGASAIGVYKLSYSIINSNLIATFISIMIAVAVYFVLVFETKAIKREDAALIPKGDLIIRIAEKLHLIK